MEGLGHTMMLVVLDEHLVVVLQIAFTVPVSLVMHDFWNEMDEDKRQVELIQFAKVRHDNLAFTTHSPSLFDSCYSSCTST
jgi:hypothetical protein